MVFYCVVIFSSYMEKIFSFIISNIIPILIDLLGMLNDDGCSVDSGVDVLVCLLKISKTCVQV